MIFVVACNQNEKESPETTAKCKSSCVGKCLIMFLRDTYTTNCNKGTLAWKNTLMCFF